MISFKHYLQEFRSNVPKLDYFEKDILIDWLKDAKLLRFVLGIKNEKAIVIYEYNNFGKNDKFIILADRVDKTDIVGYAWLNNKDNFNFWQVKDIWLYEPYRGKGLGTNLYIKLAKEGYNLMNGYSLSAEAEKVWRKLPEYVNVYTLDKETGELSDMDERPKEDKAWDNEQRYFWVTSIKDEKLKESMWHGSDPWFEEWLNGRIAPGFCSDIFEGTY